ncbi:OmpA family protein [Porphyromonas sp.]|uniref:OmpA family protein n=1 Tax=Porphyromonas sp. TaxID=1924944 RepID=UPI0026DBC95F|nr:OmpA family protein [Porphyromonas sp.]MDO4771923.1 OmpA family protein [Porphyromonas sp.]
MTIKNIIYSFSVLALSLCTTTVVAQEDQPAKKAWEIGVGGSLINWNRVSITGSEFTKDMYHYNMDVKHVMPGANLYIARELNRWFYLDVQGTMGIVRNADKESGKYGFLWMVGPGLQLRLGSLFNSKYVEPYLRAGINYMSKDFSSLTQGNFTDDKTGTAKWQSDDTWSRGRVSQEKNAYFPLSLGVGFNTWLNNHVGIGLQGDYIISLRKDEPQFAQATMRVMFRIGGEDKRPRPQVKYVEVEKLVDRIVEKPVEKIVEKTITKYAILDRITFEFNKSTLTSENNFILDQIAEMMTTDSSLRLLITGYTDAVGNSTYNKDLSLRRAKTVYDELIARGVNPANLKYRGAGKATHVAAPHEGNDVRKGDRKVSIEKISDDIYWNRL